MIVVFAFVITGVAIGTAIIVSALRAQVTPRELRGDWWSRFEAEFRDYARRSPRT